MQRPSPEHPTQELLFYICGSASETEVAEIRDLIIGWGSSRPWVMSPPEFLDVTEEPNTGNPVDESVRTVGGVHHVYAAHPPWSTRLPPDIDKQHLDEVEFIVQSLCKFSAQYGNELALELGQVPIGWIQNGVADKSIRTGLLDEWRKRLEQK